MFRGNEYCNVTETPTHHPHTHTQDEHRHQPVPFSRVLSVQLSLRDVNSFGGRVSTCGGYHGGQRREGAGRVEEAVRGESGAFGGRHLL